uniref:Transglutaminase-like superfamily protein n=1 Tax=Candidatus Kentrum sp. LPFa TaxID=2126335 RepID=A0A450WN26_9GAMM|nr:MAG: Transglutaminase-like superfamily protein [Candidatus Kentron sp. LPFa]
MKASQTLELGFGMCTTKSNLQIALLRALGIEAKLGKALVKTDYMSSFILPAYLKRIKKKKIKHYFTMARLEGQWFRSDASFSREAISMLAEKYPRQFSHLVGAKFEKGKHFFVEIEGEMMDTSSEIMREKPFYRHGNIEAMNILLDKRQGLFMPAPHWIRLTLKLLNDDPDLAILKAMAGLMGDTEKLRLAIRERNALYKNRHFTVRSFSSP